MFDYKEGDLVKVTGYPSVMPQGTVGLVLSTVGALTNVWTPYGSFAFTQYQIKLITKETTCTQ